MTPGSGPTPLFQPTFAFYWMNARVFAFSINVMGNGLVRHPHMKPFHTRQPVAWGVPRTDQSDCVVADTSMCCVDICRPTLKIHLAISVLTSGSWDFFSNGPIDKPDLPS